MINRTVSKFIPLAFVIFGIIVIIFSIKGLNIQDDFLPAKGVIQDIQEFSTPSSDGGSDTTFEVTVDYTVDGKAYTSVMGDYEEGYEVGKEIDILYDPQDPTVIVSKGKGPFYYFIGISIFVIIVGLFTFIRGLFR